jgi:hypothetical protein
MRITDELTKRQILERRLKFSEAEVHRLRAMLDARAGQPQLIADLRAEIDQLRLQCTSRYAE